MPKTARALQKEAAIIRNRLELHGLLIKEYRMRNPKMSYKDARKLVYEDTKHISDESIRFALDYVDNQRREAGDRDGQS